MSEQRVSYFASRARSPVIVSILKQAQEKINAAAEKGDVTEVARLTGLYTKSPVDYFIERPVDVEGELNRFCFTNRRTGFAVVDQELALTGDDLYETFTALGDEPRKFATPEALREWVTGPHNDPSQFNLVYLEWMDFSRVVLLTPWSASVDENFERWVRDFGFETAMYTYDSDWYLMPWMSGFIQFTDQSVQSTEPVPYFTFDNVIKWLDKVPCARPIPSYSGMIPGHGLVMESKVYHGTVPLSQQFMVEIDKQIVYNKNQIVIKERLQDGTETPVEFEMGEDGTININIALPPIPNFQTYVPDRTFLVYQSVGGVETFLDIQIQPQYTYIADQTRVTLEVMSAENSGNDTYVSFKLKDTYHPDIDSNQLSDVFCYVEDTPTPYMAEWNGTFYRVNIPQERTAGGFKMKVTATMQRRVMVSNDIIPTGGQPS